MARLFKKENADFEVSISVHTMVRAIALLALTVGLVFAVRLCAHALTLIGIAFFLALALNSPVQWLARHLPGKKKNNRTMATLISTAVIVVLLVGFVWTIVPPVTAQTVDFVRGLPQLVKDAETGQGAIGTFVARHNLQSHIQNLANKMSQQAGGISDTAFSALSRVGGGIVSLLTVIVMMVMMLLEGPVWRRIILDIIPEAHRPRVTRQAHDMNRVIQGYVNGQVTLAAIASILILPMLLILHVSYPLALVVVVFICGLIPMVGHTIGATICTLVALFTSPSAALILLAYYIFYQQVENYAVQPRVQANSTNMSPLLVFMSVLIGASFGGLLGGLVAIPVAGCLRIALLDYLESRRVLSHKVVHDAKTQGGSI